MKKWILILSVIACTQMVVGADDNLRYLDLGFNPEDLGFPEGLDFDEATLEQAPLERQPQATLNQLPYLIRAQAPLETGLHEDFASVEPLLDMQTIVAAGADLALTAPVMRAPLPDQAASQQDQPAQEGLLSSNNQAYLNQFAIPPTVITQATQASQKKKLFECVTCRKGFTRNDNLKTHMKIHTGKGLYGCTICNKKFTKNGDLKIHMRIHTNERPYACTITNCNRAFKQKNALDSHMRSHTGEKPYKCDICGQGFSDNSICTAHKRIHTGEKPYACSICGKTFTHKSSCTRHEATHGPK